MRGNLKGFFFILILLTPTLSSRRGGALDPYQRNSYHPPLRQRFPFQRLNLNGALRAVLIPNRHLDQLRIAALPVTGGDAGGEVQIFCRRLAVNQHQAGRYGWRTSC